MTEIFTNATVTTMDEERPEAEAFAVSEGVFTFVGTGEEAREYARRLESEGKSVTLTDLAGKSVLPAFQDSHMHFVGFAKHFINVDLNGCASIQEVQQRLRDRLERSGTDGPEEDAWMEATGWNQDYFTEGERRFPTAKDLDEAVGDRPVIALRVCEHVGVVSSAGMRLFGLTREKVRELGEFALTDEAGEPLGIFREKVLDQIRSRVHILNREILEDIILKAQEEALSYGLATIHTDDIGFMPDEDYHLLFSVYRDLLERGELKIRICQQSLRQRPELIRKYYEDGFRYGGNDHHLRVTGIKLLGDGSLGARSAGLRRPYADDPSTCGLTIFTEDQLDELVETAHDLGYPVLVHAIGDRTIEMVLDALERDKRNRKPEESFRDGVVHVQITDEALLERFREQDVMALVQPVFIDYDMHIVRERTGDMADTSYAWKTLADKGVHVSFGTDCPVESCEPLPNIYTAVTRHCLTGDEQLTYRPEEGMSVYEAVRACTVEGAYASGEEDVKGMIREGMLADFIIPDRDLFSLADPEELRKIRILATYIDGEKVYERA